MKTRTTREPSRLKRLRLLRGLTTVDVAHRIGYARTSLWEWEHGHRTIPDDAKPKLARLYGCSVEKIA